jgi:hypothetical protein
VFNNLHSRLRDLGDFSKFGVTRDVKFRRSQILDIVLQKLFLVDPNFRVPNLEEHNESEEYSPTEARRRNLSPRIGTQSQGAPTYINESLNSMHLISETCHPQLDESNSKNCYPSSVEELDFGLVVAAPPIFHIGEMHVGRVDIENHTKSPEKNSN